MDNLIIGSDFFDKKMRFLIMDEFGDTIRNINDKYMNRFFVDYIQKELITNIRSDEINYTIDQTQDEKSEKMTLPIDFFDKINNSEIDEEKFRYAKRGGNFSIIYSMKPHKMFKRNYFTSYASNLYDVASFFSHNDSEERLFNILSNVPTNLSHGIENIITQVQTDGLKTINRAYNSIINQYQSELEIEDYEELAQQMVNFSRMLSIEPKQIPLREEHFHYLFK